VQNNLKRVRHQGISEAFRARYACYCRNRPLLQQLIDHQLPTTIDYAVRVHVLNCYRCRQVYSELKDLSGIKHEAEDAAELYGRITPLRSNKKTRPPDNRELAREQKLLIEKAHELIERLKKE
jgi:hypothetical protein